MKVTPPTALRRAALRDRKRLLDSLWLAHLSLVLGALMLPWWLGLAELPFPSLARQAAGFALLFGALAWAADRLRHPTALLASLYGLHAAGILFTAYLWAAAGGLGNPGLLSVFSVGVVASGLVGLRWLPFQYALFSSAAVGTVSLAQSGELRWFLMLLGLEPGWIRPLASLPVPLPGPGMEPATTPQAQATLLLLFSAVQLALALTASALSESLERMKRRLGSYRDQSRELSGIFEALLRASPSPSLVAYSDSLQVVHLSDSLKRRLLLRPEEVAGRSLFELIHFERASEVERGLQASSGELPLQAIQVGPERLIANLHFYHTDHERNRYLTVQLEEITELYYFHAAFDSLSEALLILDGESRLLFSNREASRLLGDLYLGQEMRELLRSRRLLDPASAGSPSRRVTLDDVPYFLEVSQGELPGEAGACRILRLRKLEESSALRAAPVRDPATGLHNQRYFDEYFPKLVDQASRESPMLLCLFRLDERKRIEARLGAEAGEACLAHAAGVVAAQLRSGDLLARLGEDDLAAALPATSLENGLRVWERVDAELERTPLPLADAEPALSVSAGIAACRPGEPPERLFQRALDALDEALGAGPGQRRVAP